MSLYGTFGLLNDGPPKFDGVRVEVYDDRECGYSVCVEPDGSVTEWEVVR